MNHRDKLRETLWKAPEQSFHSPSNLSQKRGSVSIFPNDSQKHMAELVDSTTSSKDNLLGIT
jgi:hypothetical protein